MAISLLLCFREGKTGWSPLLDDYEYNQTVGEWGDRLSVYPFFLFTNNKCYKQIFNRKQSLEKGGLALCTRYHVLSISSVHMFDHFKNKNKNADYEACGYVVKFLYVLGTNPSARPYLVIAKIQIIYTDKGYWGQGIGHIRDIWVHVTWRWRCRFYKKKMYQHN